MARAFWIDLFTGTTWEEFLSAGASVSGFRETQWATVKKVAPGDWLLCYVAGVSRFIAIREVTGMPFRDAEQIWQEDTFPVRLPVKVVLKLEPEHAVPVTTLRDRLSYFQSASPTAWTAHFRRSPMAERSEDAQAIVEALEAATSDPLSRPFPEAKWHRKLGGTLPSKDEEVFVPPKEEDTPQENDGSSSATHEEIQSLLLKLGSEMGFALWVARNDRGKAFRGKVLGEVPGVRDKLPAQFDPATNRTIELIDVLWLDENAIVAAFEVEHTTSVYSGLLRMADLVSMQPGINIRLYIVAPDERRGRVLSEISRPVFSRMRPPLRDRCQFIPYSELRAKEQQLRGLAQYLKPEFLDEIAESAD
jgi:hypothetical protein